MRAFIISASLVLASAPGGGENAQKAYSANSRVPGCHGFLDNAGPLFPAGQCDGLVEGIVIGIEMRSMELKAPLPFCIPKAATNSQMVRVVVQYIEQRPQRMHEQFTKLAYEALKEAWPCKP
jgi:hypothetical protein